MQGRSKAAAASILQRFKLFNLVSLTRVCLVVANPKERSFAAQIRKLYAEWVMKISIIRKRLSSSLQGRLILVSLESWLFWHAISGAALSLTVCCRTDSFTNET
jgi:hypothetical protein